MNNENGITTEPVDIRYKYYVAWYGMHFKPIWLLYATVLFHWADQRTDWMRVFHESLRTRGGVC